MSAYPSSRLTPAVLACALLAGCATNEAALREKGATPLSAAEVQKVMVSGKPINARTASTGVLSTSIFRPDGSASVDWGSGNDTGSWHMEGDRFCAKWKVVRGGEEVCFAIYRKGDREYAMFRPDGSLHATLTMP